MSTLTDQLSKAGVSVNAEFNNPGGRNTIENIQSLFWLDIWAPRWAHISTSALGNDILNISEERYIAILSPLCCCCRRRRPTSDSTNDIPLEPINDDKDNKKSRRDYHSFEDQSSFIMRLILIFIYGMHYVIHSSYRIPYFYVIVLYKLFVTTIFRISRNLFLRTFDCCACFKYQVLRWILLATVNFFVTLITVPFGIAVYWGDVLINKFLLIVLAALLFFRTVYETINAEPFRLDEADRKWLEFHFSTWAWAADQIVNDPDSIECESVLRAPLFNVEMAVEALCALVTSNDSRALGEVLGPFFFQLVVVWIVWRNVVFDPDIAIGGETSEQLRIFAALGAFFYYTNKASQSCETFLRIAKGHTSIIVLTVDFIANAILPYFIIPLAVFIVLDASGLDVVLNILAIEFVTEIDEQVFDDHSKERYGGPYVIVLKPRFLEKSVLGLWNDSKASEDNGHLESEPSVAVDVYRCIELDYDNKQKAWVRDSSLSRSFRLEGKEILDRMENVGYGWNVIGETERLCVRNPDSKVPLQPPNTPEHWKRSYRKVHFNIHGFPEKKSKSTIDSMSQEVTSALKHTLDKHAPLGLLSKRILEGVHKDSKDFKPVLYRTHEHRNYFFSQEQGYGDMDENLARAFFHLDAKNEHIHLKVVRCDGGHTLMHRINPVIPISEDHELDQLFEPLTRFFSNVLRRNFKDPSDEKLGQHMKIFGSCSETHDSRIMIIHDYPFEHLAAHYRGKNESFGTGDATMPESLGDEKKRS